MASFKARFINFLVQSGAFLSRLSRGMASGVRVTAFDAENRAFLVRHQYLTGWYFPGGAVESGETIAEAARRELVEETGYGYGPDVTLLSLHLNRGGTGRDQVGLFKVSLLEQDPNWIRPALEISDLQLFALDALPDDVSPATLRRLKEIAGEGEPDPYW